MKIKSTLVILLGVICVAAAAALTGNNIYIQSRAGIESEITVKELNAIILSQIEKPEMGKGTETEDQMSESDSTNDNKLSSENTLTSDDTYQTQITDCIEDSIPDNQVYPKEYVLFPEIEMPSVSVDGNDYIGVLRIDSLGMELPIIGDWSYSSLRIAPSRYSGSVYKNNMVLCGHNYKTHFGKLDRLNYGDIVTFTDMSGNEFIYEVAEIEVINPTDIEKMVESDYALTMFTCNISGKARITVRCSLVSDNRYTVY